MTGDKDDGFAWVSVLHPEDLDKAMDKGNQAALENRPFSMEVRVRSSDGWRNGIVLKPGKFNADVDFKHPLSGRVLHYEVEVELIREASKEEIAQGRPLIPNDAVRSEQR